MNHQLLRQDQDAARATVQDCRIAEAEPPLPSYSRFRTLAMAAGVFDTHYHMPVTVTLSRVEWAVVESAARSKVRCLPLMTLDMNYS